MTELDEIILSGLVQNKDYADSVIPYLKSEYFFDESENTLFNCIVKYYQTYKVMPDQTALYYEATHEKNVNKTPEQIEEIKYKINNIFNVLRSNPDWTIEKTEEFCRDKAAFLVVQKAIQVLNGDIKNLKPGVLPDMMRDAINITFDTRIGHDWKNDAEARFEYYTNPEFRIKFLIQALNEITDGGVPRKTLNLILAGPNAGKTALMCQLAADYVRQGYNVGYCTFEMSEEEISKRIDANVLDIELKELKNVSKEFFLSKFEEIKQKSYGELIVKEYANGSAHCGHIANFIKDVQQKKGIKLDVVFIDYIGICASSRLNISGVNTYTYQKAIAEEMRALGQEFGIAIWSGVQMNRTAAVSSDVDMSGIADSFGIPATADFIISLIRTEEYDEVNKILLKQIKSRYANKGDCLRFLLGVDPNKNVYYDVDQDGFVDDPNKKEKLDAYLKEQNEKTKSMFNKQPSTAERFSDFG